MDLSKQFEDQNKKNEKKRLLEIFYFMYTVLLIYVWRSNENINCEFSLGVEKTNLGELKFTHSCSQ